MDEENKAALASEEHKEDVVTEEDTATDDEKAKALEIAENQKKRAEKAEREAKELKAKLKELEGTTAPSQTTTLSEKDRLALYEAKVTTDDLDEVLEFAAFKKVSVTEALKNTTLRSLLSERAEERKTAAATQTRSARGSKQTTGQDLLDKARSTGQIPDDDAQIQAMAQARLAARRAASK